MHCLRDVLSPDPVHPGDCQREPHHFNLCYLQLCVFLCIIAALTKFPAPFLLVMLRLTIDIFPHLFQPACTRLSCFSPASLLQPSTENPTAFVSLLSVTSLFHLVLSHSHRSIMSCCHSWSLFLFYTGLLHLYRLTSTSSLFQLQITTSPAKIRVHGDYHLICQPFNCHIDFIILNYYSLLFSTNDHPSKSSL